MTLLRWRGVGCSLLGWGVVSPLSFRSLPPLPQLHACSPTDDEAEKILQQAYQEARAAGAGAGGGLQGIQEGEGEGEEGGDDMDTDKNNNDSVAPPLEPLVDEEGFETVVVGKKKKAYKKV